MSTNEYVRTYVRIYKSTKYDTIDTYTILVRNKLYTEHLIEIMMQIGAFLRNQESKTNIQPKKVNENQNLSRILASLVKSSSIYLTKFNLP